MIFLLYGSYIAAKQSQVEPSILIYEIPISAHMSINLLISGLMLQKWPCQWKYKKPKRESNTILCLFHIHLRAYNVERHAT